MTNQEQYELICEKAKKYDKLVDILDKIKAEMEKISIAPFATAYTAKHKALAIIDKYKAESEDKEWVNK